MKLLTALSIVIDVAVTFTLLGYGATTAIFGLSRYDVTIGSLILFCGLWNAARLARKLV